MRVWGGPDHEPPEHPPPQDKEPRYLILLATYLDDQPSATRQVGDPPLPLSYGQVGRWPSSTSKPLYPE